MITKAEFLTKIHGSIFPQLKKFELERQSALKKWGISMTILSICLLALGVYYVGIENIKDSFVIILIISFIPAFFGYAKLNRFSYDLKQKFIPSLYDILDLKNNVKEGGSLRYIRDMEKNTELSELELQKLDSINHKFIQWTKESLFPTTTNDFYYDDCFSDKKNTLSMSEITLEKQNRKSTTILFKGPVLELKTNIKTNSKILILEKLSFFSSKSFKPRKKLNYQKWTTNDTLFDTQFDVYAKSDLEVKSILNKMFLHQILQVKDLYPKAIMNLLIENEKITLSINTGKNMFEFFSIYKSILQDKFFEKYYDEIKTLFDIQNIFKS